MSNKIGTVLMLAFATLQVACGESKKDKAMDAFMAKCQSTTGCVDSYKYAASQTAIAGAANTAGLAQVATPGATVQPGQVPSPTVLPASVSNAQVQATTQKIQSQLQSLNAQAAQSTSSSAPMSSEPTQVEIGVTRLSTASATAPVASNPISLQPSSVTAPVAQQEATELGVGAGR